MTQRFLAFVLIVSICAHARANTADFNALAAGSSYAAPALFSNGGLDFDVLYSLGNLNVSAVSGQANPAFTGNFLKLTSNTALNVNLPTGASQIKFDYVRNNSASAYVVNGGWVDLSQIPVTVNGVAFVSSMPTTSTWGAITATGNIDSFYIIGTDYLVDNLNATLVAGLSGDYNKNHAVDAGDFVLWRKTLASRSGFNSWRSSFGGTNGAGTSVALSPVPEPSTIGLLLVGLQWIAFAHRRRVAPPSA